MPKQNDNVLEFKNFHNQCKAPFAIYADFECLTVPVNKCSNDPSKSYTSAYQQHEPSGFSMYVVGSDYKPGNFKPIVYRGQNTAEEFILSLKGLEHKIMKRIKDVKPMVMTAKDEDNFEKADCCHLCKKPFVSGEKPVRDHDHLTGQYRGAAHNKCNLEEGKKRTRNFKIPVFFHNLKNYDSHIIISQVGKH
eukprot:SAG11_NODE_7121_length_1189_cov_231.339450_1_plen_191_part_10